ncbi:cysteine hydrolase family protein [Paenibacillus sp. WLX2291]|uniref:cysteine hydrolase family protein n=1 Tax=Paenibacillus sp. WLX2291 TaxID=3296934 RepID=UPI0039844F21
MSADNTALLVMDMQNSIVSRFVQQEQQLEPFQQAIAVAREHGIQVIYIHVGFRDGYPEVHPSNKMFGGVAARGGNTDPEQIKIHDAVAPQEGEAVVMKKRFSAFTGSDLEVILRSNRIEHLVLSGIATSGVVLSTLREASDKDYVLTVLSDACIDADPEVHRVLTEKVFPVQAEVITVNEWAKSLH